MSAVIRLTKNWIGLTRNSYFPYCSECEWLGEALSLSLRGNDDVGQALAVVRSVPQLQQHKEPLYKY